MVNFFYSPAQLPPHAGQTSPLNVAILPGWLFEACVFGRSSKTCKTHSLYIILPLDACVFWRRGGSGGTLWPPMAVFVFFMACSGCGGPRYSSVPEAVARASSDPSHAARPPTPLDWGRWQTEGAFATPSGTGGCRGGPVRSPRLATSKCDHPCWPGVGAEQASHDTLRYRRVS